MALNEGIQTALKEHLIEFVQWMEDGWCMTDADREATVIEDLPDTPEEAYQKGYNAACEAVSTAYELYSDEIDS